ncbi:PEP-CTERM sorting domain-containing protein [Psychrosphaera ytuae]|uniref:PEP-CTERM sorting domain-containing protein n=1 Tax=Psychrosphaera ytuae TaxID=2820710 RepID=A0A975DA11_9GAMM|nr:nidogen-like domain-containing protein [Psychrosphaera ytuae]QTH63292.1 PEP-CTERM sorting domain-containing protein [Psychrosphaera ytuae]
MKLFKNLLVTVLLAFTVTKQAQADVILYGMGGESQLGDIATPKVDDGSSNELQLPFTLSWGGSSASTFFVNTNGNITFGSGFTRFSATSFDNVPFPIIAPFWGDVDISCDTCGDIYVGSPEEGVVAVTWDRVAEYGNTENSARNTFQAVLIDRSGDTGVNGDFDVEFRYQNLEWSDNANAGFGLGNGAPPIDECEVIEDCSDFPPIDDCEVSDCEGFPPCEIESVCEFLPIPQSTQLSSLSLEQDILEAPTYYSLPGSLTEEVLELANTSNSGEEGVWTFSFRDGQYASEGQAPISLDNVDYIPEVGETPDNPRLPDGTTEEGGWEFDFEIDFGEIVFIDPDVAVGYDYVVNSGPNFASVILPSGFDARYELWLMGANGWEFADNLVAEVEYFFGQGGVSMFRILGIDTSNMIDPTDAQAFVTGLSFVAAGTIDMSQTPITEFVADPAVDVNEPNALILLSLGLGFLAFRRRKA